MKELIFYFYLFRIVKKFDLHMSNFTSQLAFFILIILFYEIVSVIYFFKFILSSNILGL